MARRIVQRRLSQEALLRAFQGHKERSTLAPSSCESASFLESASAVRSFSRMCSSLSASEGDSSLMSEGKMVKKDKKKEPKSIQEEPRPCPSSISVSSHQNSRDSMPCWRSLWSWARARTRSRCSFTAFDRSSSLENLKIAAFRPLLSLLHSAPGLFTSLAVHLPCGLRKLRHEGLGQGNTL